jgi:hypothetical protein
MPDDKRPTTPRRKQAMTCRKAATNRAGARWSAGVTAHSNALDLDTGVFNLRGAKSIARSSNAPPNAANDAIRARIARRFRCWYFISIARAGISPRAAKDPRAGQGRTAEPLRQRRSSRPRRKIKIVPGASRALYVRDRPHPRPDSRTLTASDRMNVMGLIRSAAGMSRDASKREPTGHGPWRLPSAGSSSLLD